MNINVPTADTLKKNETFKVPTKADIWIPSTQYLNLK